MCIRDSRSAADDAQQTALVELQANSEIVYVQGDITDPGVATVLVDAAEATGKPLRGVMHCAAVIDDALLGALAPESLDRVWGPKVLGALALNDACAHRELDWWVVFSSVASLLGSPGQGAYAAANAWTCLLYTSPSPRDLSTSRMPSSA